MTEDQMTELAGRAHTAVKHLGFSVHKSCYIDMANLKLTPSFVAMTANRGFAPRRSQFKTGEEYKAAHAKWFTDTKAAAEANFKPALAELKKAKIRYRTGVEYGWPVARLA